MCVVEANSFVIECLEEERWIVAMARIKLESQVNIMEFSVVKLHLIHKTFHSLQFSAPGISPAKTCSVSCTMSQTKLFFSRIVPEESEEKRKSADRNEIENSSHLLLLAARAH